jgi:single-stranded-DNA-specific exonuclease
MNIAVKQPARRLFLGVARSASGLAWEHRLTEREENVALAIAQVSGLPEILARVLAGRGIRPEQAESFLDPSIRALLPDPASLTDLVAAAGRIAMAIENREGVAVFGDYDVDGAASAALVKRFLDHFGIANEIYIPDRIFEGYGPTPRVMTELARRGAGLIICVDCGTNSAEAITAAQAAGADVIVIDHHQVSGALPADVPVVNPNREDDLSGQGHLCAAGVTFLVLVQVAAMLRSRASTPPDLLGLLDLVALATVCDVVPLVGVNRAFVVKGLAAARAHANPGIAALARAARIGEPINCYHLGFLIGPRINAGGRIGDAALGSRLLATGDAIEAEAIATTLDRLNRERQAIEQDMLIEARAQATQELGANGGPPVLVTASEGWHPGVVGLIASRLKELGRRPAFAIALGADGLGTGSGRSVPGFDLGRLVREAVCEGLIEKGGGHAMAAGLTVRRERLGALRAFLEERAAEDVTRLLAEERLAVDGALTAEGATLELHDLIEKAGPYGSGHAQPVFVLPRHRITDARTVGNGHIRLDLRSELGGRLQAIAFRAEGSPLGDFLAANRGRTVNLAGSLSAGYWNGVRRLQFRVNDAAEAV